jgi:hypothetical protein
MILLGSSTKRWAIATFSAVLIYNIYKSSAGPYAYSTVLATFHKISIFYSHAFNDGSSCAVVLVHTDAGATVPVTALGLVIYLDNVFASGRNNAARVEHHACYRVVVGVGVVDGTSPEIPDLTLLALEHSRLA